MRNDWQHKALRDVCEIRPPKPEALEKLKADALVSFAPMEDLGIDQKYLRPAQVKPLCSVIGSYTYFAEGDVLLAKITPCFENGKLGIATDLNAGVGFGSSEFIVLRPRPVLEREFLYYYLSREDFRSQGKRKMGGAVGQQRVAKEFIEGYSIPVPSVPEQRRIVGALDELFDDLASAKANTSRNLENALALLESSLQSEFVQADQKWPKRSLKEVSKDFGRGKSKHRPRNDPKLYGGKYPFIQTGDVRNANHLITTYNQTYNEQGLAQSKLWPRGTLCITIAANIAETGILNFDACFPDSVIGVVVNNAVTSTKFLQYLLQSFKALLKAQGKGSAQDNINLGTFENQLFPFPKLKVQEGIVSRLDDLSANLQHLQCVYQQKLAAFEALKGSLLQQAFTGRL